MSVTHLESTLLLADLQQLDASLLKWGEANHLPNNLPNKLDALLELALCIGLLGLERTLGEGLPVVNAHCKPALLLGLWMSSEPSDATNPTHGWHQTHRYR